MSDMVNLEITNQLLNQEIYRLQNQLKEQPSVEPIPVAEPESVFFEGDAVFKPKGYRFVGEVVSVFEKTDGEVRLVVENQDGLLHIFSPNQMRHSA